MVSLKMTPAEAKAEGFGAPAEIKPPEYPWGTSITLIDEVVKALFPKGLPKVGDEFALDAAAKVVSVSENEREGEGPRMSVELQFTELATETDGDKDLGYYGKAGPWKAAD